MLAATLVFPMLRCERCLCSSCTVKENREEDRRLCTWIHFSPPVALSERSCGPTRGRSVQRAPIAGAAGITHRGAHAGPVRSVPQVATRQRRLLTSFRFPPGRRPFVAPQLKVQCNFGCPLIWKDRPSSGL